MKTIVQLENERRKILEKYYTIVEQLDILKKKERIKIFDAYTKQELIDLLNEELRTVDFL